MLLRFPLVGETGRTHMSEGEKPAHYATRSVRSLISVPRRVPLSPAGGCRWANLSTARGSPPCRSHCRPCVRSVLKRGDPSALPGAVPHDVFLTQCFLHSGQSDDRKSAAGISNTPSAHLFADFASAFGPSGICARNFTTGTVTADFPARMYMVSH